MYKILLLVRPSETKPLWTEYRENEEPYESDDLEEVEEKLKELLETYTHSQLRVVEDMSYTLDILFDS